MGLWRSRRSHLSLSFSIHIVARGKIGRGPESELFERYAKRIVWPVRITELPETGGTIPVLPRAAKTVALDEKGRQLRSVELARILGKWRDEGVPEVRFLIGAASGLTPEERDSADVLMGFGKATWPHLLVRAMLAEQLWRAHSILANHPYHREG